MKRSELEKYLGKNVKIKLYNNDVIKGELHKTGEEMYKNVPELYIPRKFYFVTERFPSLIFRSSHVKKLEEV